MQFHEIIAKMHASLTDEQRIYVEALMAKYQAHEYYAEMVDPKVINDEPENHAVTQALVLMQLVPEDEFQKLGEVLGEGWESAITACKMALGISE